MYEHTYTFIISIADSTLKAFLHSFCTSYAPLIQSSAHQEMNLNLTCGCIMHVITYVKVSFMCVCRSMHFYCTVYLYVHMYIVHTLCCAKECTSHSQHRFETKDLGEQSVYVYVICIYLSVYIYVCIYHLTG